MAETKKPDVPPGKVHKAATAVVSVATKAASATKDTLGTHIPRAASWASTLTGLTASWNTLVLIARNPSSLILLVPVLIGVYLLGHHEASNAWKPVSTALISCKKSSAALANELSVLRARPVPVCAAPAAPPAAAPPTKAAAPKHKKRPSSWLFGSL